MVTQGKCIFLGYRELLGGRQLVQEWGSGEAGLRRQAQLAELTMLFEQLISTERHRRQMIQFACSRGPGPVLTTFNPILGLTMQSLTGNANRTSLRVPQPDTNNRAHTHHSQLNTDPCPMKNLFTNARSWRLGVGGMMRGGWQGMAGKGVVGPRRGIPQGSSSGPEHRKWPSGCCCTKVAHCGF